MGRIAYGSNYESVPKDEICARLSRRAKQRRKAGAKRIRKPPRLFSHETFLPGSRNQHAKGRPIDSFDRSFQGYVWFEDAEGVEDAKDAEDTEYVPQAY